MTAIYDAVVIGSGPNGLAAATAIARSGLAVHVIEAADRAGGGMRTETLTLPGFHHDTCSSVHPLGVTSPWFRALGIEPPWIEPDAPLVHMLAHDRSVVFERSLASMVSRLGRDGAAYEALFEPMVAHFDVLIAQIMGPLRAPEHPIPFGRFGLHALRSLRGLVRDRFHGDEVPALLAGIAAHAMIPLDATATASFALVLALAGHAAGWPIARGGSHAIADALLAELTRLGGTIEVGHRIVDFRELPAARAYLFDTDPRQLVQICGDRLPARYRDRIARYRYGPGVFKIDWALAAPIPWRDPDCRRAATVHLAGTIDEISNALVAVNAGHASNAPFVLVGQPTLFDPTRAPPGQHTAWAYCHVPAGASLDMTPVIEARIDEFAPGFRDLILARTSFSPSAIEAHDPNFVGGDINIGLADWRQLLFRPMLRRDPYSTGADGIYLCSSATPPGGGVHGMCGYWAAASALRDVFEMAPPPLA